ncbi:carbohydrate binding family 9 domain-containing protein [Candidatus Aminicenantes bacterium AH-873-B07]|nr:carbohydrate binding family 9 domain-containing protein [Candidatus Aminicenantes bacterium AH-873-B07]
MRKLIALIIAIFSFNPFLIFSFVEAKQTQEQKIIRAIRTNEQIRVDGILKEKVWKNRGYSDFVQSDPIDGAKPTEKTVVWIAYDDEALYVAAQLYDSQPELIVCRLGRRDDFLDSDWFIFAIDPYYDRRSGFQFAVNPAGSIVDWTLYNDEWRDNTWDGVWDWAVNVNEKGWTVEIKIPFNQLRFQKREEYIWGVNFVRIIKRKNERDTYVWIPKGDSGYVSRFAKLIGIRNISPGRHIEFFPYTVGEAKFSPSEPGNPFKTGKDYLGNIGFDIKIGVRSNLTLDATINPDFGQVEVDPAVINLSAYETYYQEKRPFFIEGSNIFNAFGRGGSTMNVNINFAPPSFFYSRRIGRSPQGYVSRSGYIKFPDRTTILGAFKLTGKINGLNLGFINAFTAREYAEIDFKGRHFKEEVEPFSYYGVLRLQKEFNEGRHGIGFIATSVIRNLRNENLEDILNKRAFSLAIDGWTFLDKNKGWVLTGWLGGTLVEGSKTAILNLQKSSLHYFQRPDAKHVKLNEEATSLKGWSGRFTLSKQKGNFIFNMAIGAISPGFDCNDIGFQYNSFDVINSHIVFGYRWLHPGKIFRYWWFIIATFRNYDFGGNKTWEGYGIAVNGQFLNYWGFDFMFGYNPDILSNDLTRGGPLAVIPYGYQINFSISSDSRKSIVLNASTSLYNRPLEGYHWNASLSLRWKPRSNIDISFRPGFYLRHSDIQWVTKIDDPFMIDTYGTRYIFAEIKQKTLFSEIRINWTFSPKLSLQLYFQPFIAVGKYSEFKELARPRSFVYNIFGEDSSTIIYSNGKYIVDPDGPGPAPVFSFWNPNFNFKSLRGTVVLRWEYLPGSTLYFVWTQNRTDYSHPGDFNFMRDLESLFTAKGDNIFLIKISYRWNI